MSLDDPGTDAESESGAVGLGGEEGVEEAALDLRRDARAEIADGEAHHRGGLPIDADVAQFGGERDGGSGGAGIGGIADEVDQHLAKLLGIGGKRSFIDWAEPDLDHAASLLVRVRENPEEAMAKAPLAREQLQRDYSPEGVGRAMVGRLERLGDGRAAHA